MVKIHLALLITVILSLACSTGAQQPEPLDADVARQVQAVAEAKTPDDAAKALKTLFNGADRKKLERLKQVKEDGVALRSAWEEVLLSGTPRDGKHPIYGPAKFVDSAVASRFVQFVEKRTDVGAPVWWKECVRNSFRLHDKSRVIAGELTDADPPEIAELKVEGVTTTLHSGKASVVLSAEIAKKFPDLRAALFRDGVCFAASPRSVGYSFPVVSIDRQTGKRIWDNKVWGFALEGGASGSWFQHVSRVGSGDRILVFGSGNYTFYIEAFDANMGRNEFRFASWYSAERVGRPK